MKILSVSDTHAQHKKLKNLDSCDLIVHAGDWAPDKPSYLPISNVEFQRKWFISKLPEIKEWVGNKKILFVQGNHDFLAPEEQESILKSAGIDAQHLHERIVKFKGHNFYGLPYVNYINGSFNHEAFPKDLKEPIEKLIKMVNKSEIDIIVAHAPPAGILDVSRGIHFGLNCITNAFAYRFEQFPKAYICGHIHESNGTYNLGDTIIVNSATTQHIVEV